MTKFIQNIGEIILDDVSLTDTRIGVYIPLVNEADNVRRLRKQLEGWLMQETQVLQREVRFQVGAMKTVPCLYINIGEDEKSGKYEVGYSVVFMGVVEDDRGRGMCWNITDPSPVELFEEDKKYFKQMILSKLQETMYEEERTCETEDY